MKKKKKLITTKLCSGYGVFPGGKKCPGCIDCNGEKVTMRKVVKIINSKCFTLKKGKNK